MMIIKLKPELTVYDCRKGYDRLRPSRWSIWPVRIISVDIENETVIASWNCNKPQTYHKRTWSKWRLKPPVNKDQL